MTVWILRPVDLADPNWEASSHRGPVMVRAPNARKAQAIAARAFDIKTGFRSKGMRFPPWQRSALVSIARVHDPRFDEEGATEVLEPVI